MLALLLAAGVGKRMGPNAGPKCLLPIAGKTLLELTFESLRGVGIRDVVLVVGHQKEAVVQEARARAGSLQITFVENPRFQEGAILSLWSARSFLDRDLLIMDADVFCPQAAYVRLVSSVHPNCLLVDSRSADTGEEQIVLGKDRRVLGIAKRPSLEQRAAMAVFGESVGFLRLSKESALIFRDLLGAKVRAGVVNIEHEQVYPDLFQKVTVGFEQVDDLSWIEIDTPEDLSQAERLLAPRRSPPIGA